jgi:hypothetical protein
MPLTLNTWETASDEINKDPQPQSWADAISTYLTAVAGIKGES